MVKKAILRYKIRKANGDFSVFMSRRNQTDIASLLEFAAKKANAEQRKLVSSSK